MQGRSAGTDVPAASLLPKVLAIVSTVRYIECMFKLPDFPSIDFPSVDFSKLDLDALRNFDFAKYVPSVKFPNVDLPDVDVPTIDVAKLTSAVRDAAYLTVGIGATAFEQAQARRRELITSITDGFDAAKIHVDTVVDKIEAVLPDKAAALFGQAREMTDAARNQVIGLIRNAA
jgi:hypothetical protein